MNFYIGARLENVERVKQLAALLKEKGWNHTHDWTSEESVHAHSAKDLIDIGQLELIGVKNADVVILLLPAGRGSHVELGIALANSKRIELWAQNEDFFENVDTLSPFYWFPNVVRNTGDFDGFMEKMIEKY